MDAGAHWVEPETVKACLADGNTGASHRRGPFSVHPDKKILFLRGDFIEDYEVPVPFQSPLKLLSAMLKMKAGETCPTSRAIKLT
ncbi:hypothetical protein OIU79_006222 [Salix purpurea]|uniref:Uncharacterized protein n=1 Tax=Salix purpurea TaxID=77065 RepID=A0A9Q0TUY8_SALPP|nr:hypothetical protein OIU79_006222 [Salix purpurea]